MHNLETTNLNIHKRKVDQLVKLANENMGAIWSVERGKTGHNLRNLEYKNKSIKLDISDFNQVVSINKEELFVYVEPNVRMDELVAYLLPLKFRPQIVPEFKGITVGGAIQGLAGESSSFQYGLFHHACLEYEILIGSGEIITANKTNNADLFYALPGSYGSLALITMVKLSIVPCLPYVLLNYTNQPTAQFIEYKPSGQYLDGIMYNYQEVTVVEGEEVQNKSLSINFYQQKYWFSQWYNEYVDTKRKQYQSFQDIMHLDDYFFRYDRGCFWMASYKLKHNLINRILYGSRLTSDNMYKRTISKTPESFRESQKIIQDIMVPSSSFLDVINFIQTNISIVPLWLLPVKTTNQSQELFGLPTTTDSFINIGVYGIPNAGDTKAIKRALELFLLTVGGRMVLHSECYYTEEEFWKRVFNKTEYETLREKYYATGKFINIYDKVSAYYKTLII